MSEVKKQTYRTAREKEVGIEFENTIKNLKIACNDTAYLTECDRKHKIVIDGLKRSPLDTYKKLFSNKDKPQEYLEAVVLILLKKVFEVDEKENAKFDERTLRDDADEKLLIKDVDQYRAMYDQCLLKVSQIFFKSRYYLTYRPTIETIVDLLEFIDIMCRSNSEDCKGSSSPYFHTRRYIYYLKYMLDQYDDGHILVPTYLNIGASDFIKSRCVPVYFLGCHPDPEYADEYYNTPLEFFSHDVQHARRQLYYTDKELYILKNKGDRFKQDKISKSVFDMDKTIVVDNYNTELITFVTGMSSFTKNQLEPLLLTNSKSKKYNAPLNEYITTYNEDLDKGLRSMRKMILFEVLHEAARCSLPNIIIENMMLNLHATPIERIVTTDDEKYANVQNVIYEDPATLSNVLYKTQGVFFDSLEERAEFIVPVKYRNAATVALAALEIYTALTPIRMDRIKEDANVLFNTMLHLTLNKKNRLQSTKGLGIQGLEEDSSRVYTISDVVDTTGNLIDMNISKVYTTRLSIYDDPVFKGITTFYGPQLGDQTSKVAIYGGSFNPPHECHMERLQKLYEATSINKICVGVVIENKRKPDIIPYDYRLKWIIIMITKLLIKNNDPNVESFINNPVDNTSKIQVIGTTESAGDSITEVREMYPGRDIIFVYGSDYALSPGAETPLDLFTPPASWNTSKGNFYKNVTQIQFIRDEKHCDMSSSTIRTEIQKFIKSIGESQINVADINSLPGLEDLAKKLSLDKEVLVLYIRYLIEDKPKLGGKSNKTKKIKRKINKKPNKKTNKKRRKTRRRINMRRRKTRRR